MPSRPLSPGSNMPRPSFLNKTRVIFLVLTISSSAVILFTIIYFLYHLWNSLSNRARTIPFDSSAPLKLQRFCYKDLKNATDDFDDANIIGKGGSGTVFRGIVSDGKLFAIKRLDTLSLQTEREFQNELQILGGLRSPFLVTLLGYCVEKNKRLLVYEYMPNKNLQESLFGDGNLSMNWQRRFDVILDVAKALEFLHLGCDPPVIHGDIKPSNVLLDSDYRAKISDFGLSRIKVEGEFGVDLFSQELWKSQELSGSLGGTTGEHKPAIGTPMESNNTEVDFALALQASSSSINSTKCYNVRALSLSSLNFNANLASDSACKGGINGKGKEVTCVDTGGDDWNTKFVPYDDELGSIDHSKELNSGANLGADEASGTPASMKQWGKDWWWRQDGSGELCSKDYVMEWIGSQICPSNPDWDDEKRQVLRKELGNSTQLDKLDVGEPQMQGLDFDALDKGFEKKEPKSKERKNRKKTHRKMQEWWKDDHLGETRKKDSKLRQLKIKWKKGFKMPHFDLERGFYFSRSKKFGEPDQDACDANGEFSFRRGWRRKNNNSIESDMWSGDLFSRELSSTTSMRGTLCYVAPEYSGCGYLMEKADIYSLGVLILVIVSGRRPLHVLASPMKLEKANLISWCRHLAQSGNILELVDEKLKDEYNKEQASLCINLALSCLQKMPELRPDIMEIVKILKGEMDLPPVPVEFSPSPPSKLYSRSRRKQKANAD
ncbi:LOW QUALITY PROTEIN: putative receptor-like protein kinase At1g80870 [Hibiscus syriacus]|uniref:LOW QUALITY PROTEIN: putative receptor-like protein kinase At1g80870 n=1 Tax=Hibiscus syriacus TaxID=106335 RepID=UPI0019222949|nr:LOW QUALITY PROTEIN: putative receptor-like protein kinase At1g80870 [Hibiscus syriacus]